MKETLNKKAKRIYFTTYYCEITCGKFAPNIMIFGPQSSICRCYEYGSEIGVEWRFSDLIKKCIFKNDRIDTWTYGSNLLPRVYIQTDSALFRPQNDKRISEMFSDFNTDELIFAAFCVGGPSFRCEGYLFIIHPNEDIHKNHPHVHVRRNENETRYSLNTLTRFPKDNFCKEFKKDEKKIILPYLRKNKDRLLEYWNMYMKGYIPPIEDDEGKQFYPES